MYGQCVGQSKKQQQKLTRQQLELQLAEEEDEEEEEAEALLTVSEHSRFSACCDDHSIRHSIVRVAGRFRQAAMAAAMAERNGKGSKVPPPPKKINGVTMAVQLEEDAQVKTSRHNVIVMPSYCETKSNHRAKSILLQPGISFSDRNHG